MIDYLIPESRLYTYQKIQGISPQDVVDVYFLLQDISSKLFIPLQSLEIFLRNRIHTQLKKTFDRDDWYNDDGFYMSDLSHQALKKTLDKLKDEITERGITSDDIVANLTFGFWVSMHKSTYLYHDKSLFWENNFSEVYQNFEHKKANSLEEKMSNIYNQLVIVNDVRNRLYHYEAVWKKSNGSQDFKSVINMICEKYKTIFRILKHLDSQLESKIITLKPCRELQHIFQNVNNGDKHSSFF